MFIVCLPSKSQSATIWAILTEDRAMKVMSGYLPSFKTFSSLKRGFEIVVVSGVGYSVVVAEGISAGRYWWKVLMAVYGSVIRIQL
jgi:hypothetical protein